ncbi:DUF559 domain-containing protein [Nonomuraea angiospora]|uniref:DUF559 domain-containing protein n=1 Tax=Nonomuraea angiospora TaxID=46172 RepID=UPI0034277B2C
MERTALDCARWLPRMEAVAILDQFARRGVDLEALWHRPLNSWRLRDILGLADRGAASPRESWLRVILVEGGLPRPTTQIRVALDDDRFAYLDLGWEEFKVAVEYDGQEHHTSPADQQRDADRREELRRRGWRVIAVRRDVIPGQIADLLHHVASALIECGWQPGPERTNHILRRIRAARRRSRFRLISHPPLQSTTPGAGWTSMPERQPGARTGLTAGAVAQMPVKRHAVPSAAHRSVSRASRCSASRVSRRRISRASRHSGGWALRRYISWASRRSVGWASHRGLGWASRRSLGRVFVVELPGWAGLCCVDHHQAVVGER